MTTGPEAYTYTEADGTVYYFERIVNVTLFQPKWTYVRAHLWSVTRPDGRRLNYVYKGADGETICIGATCAVVKYLRTQSITSSDGHMLKASYASAAGGADFTKLTGVMALNQSQTYCNPPANSCTGLPGAYAEQPNTDSTSGRPTPRTNTTQ